MSIFNMRILVDVVNSVSIKKTSSTFNPVDYVAFFQQEFSKIRAILTSDSCYKSNF